MSFIIQFRCTECGRDQLVDLDDRKLTHIICPDRECRHYAPKPDDDLLDELHQDARTSRFMNVISAILIAVFFGAIALALSTFWPKPDGTTSNVLDTNAYIGISLAFASFVGIILTQVRAANVDTACEF